MTAPRIDTVRNELNAARDLLDLVRIHLEDLHVVAYNRHKAADAPKVKGGQRDYALDTHGDPEARRLYAQTATDVIALVQGCAEAAHDVVKFMQDGTRTLRRDGTADATVEEVIAALDARRDRKARNEYQPALVIPQPEVKSHTDWERDYEALAAAVRKVAVSFRDEHQSCTAPPVPVGRERARLRRKFDRERLTPREREVWDRVLNLSAEKTAKAS